MTAPPLAVVLGRCDEMRAEVFFRVTLPGPAAAPRLAGTLVGPHCRRATTLPAVARVTDLGPARPASAATDVDAAVGRAIVTEPAYWTPDLPAVYRLDLKVVHGADVRRIDGVVIGLRRLGVRRRSLWLDGRRWVPRGVACTAAECDVAVLREAASTAVLRAPDEAALAAADAAGVAVIALLDRVDDAAAERIACWALHPAVMLAVLPGAATAAEVTALAAAVRNAKGTLLLAQSVAGAAPPPALADGLDCLVVSLDRGGLPHDGWRGPPPVPLLAWRQADVPCGERRRACDVLQAELAAWGLGGGAAHLAWDWAGYVVG
jgi:hypothetical protein